MTTMVERVARVICGETINPDDTFADGTPYWRLYTNEARAAIKAMRMPTRVMIEAGAKGSGEDSEAVAIITWEAMIDAALAEEEG